MWKDLSLSEQCWLAGMLDGEGCFRRIPLAKGRFSQRIEMNNTDLDVVRKVAKLMGSSVVVNDKTLDGLQKPVFRTSLSGPKALEYMIGLYPYLCRRRQIRIAHSLQDKYCFFSSVEPLSIP